MIPILFEYNTTDFSSHGIGDLIDCIDCKSSQNEDGEYELSFSYPMTGELLNELTIGRLIYAKANSWQENQIFRIYGYEKEIAGTIIVNCQHISYDLCNIPVKAFKASKTDTAANVLTKLKNNALQIDSVGLDKTKFTFSSTIEGTVQREKGYFEVETPVSIRAALLDGDDSIKGCFGGDLVFDNYKVKLEKTGGEDRGVIIEYGVDLMDLDQEHNISEMYTGVYPFYTYNNKNNNQVVTYGDIRYAANISSEYKIHRIFPLDLTSYFPNQAENSSPTAKQLNSKADEWMKKENNFGQPEISLTVSYAHLNQDVHLYDQVTVRFPKLGIDVGTKVCGYTYDVLNERMDEIEVGKTKPSAVFSLEDASHLRKGLMPPERIKDNSIGSDKISGGGVGGRNLANGAVDTDNIKDDAVKTKKIGKYQVAFEKLAEEIGAEILRIDGLAARIAYIEHLFADDATIGYIYCSAITTNVVNIRGAGSYYPVAITTSSGNYSVLGHKGGG